VSVYIWYTEVSCLGANIDSEGKHMWCVLSCTYLYMSQENLLDVPRTLPALQVAIRVLMISARNMIA